MTLAELREWGFNVVTNYTPVMAPSKFNMQETTEQYYDRCYQTTKDVLKRHEHEGTNTRIGVTYVLLVLAWSVCIFIILGICGYCCIECCFVNTSMTEMIFPWLNFKLHLVGFRCL